MRSSKAVLIETLLVAALGLVLALAANALSSRGLRLSRNYFPGGERLAVSNTVSNAASSTNVSVATADPLAATRQRLLQLGLQLVSSNEVVALYQDPRYEPGLVLIVDARDDKHYTAGHIPGAWQFNHYRAENYLPELLPLCLVAQQIVVYCAGGQCEDSEFAAIMLRDAGVPRERLFIYAAGITEWTNSNLPVELGPRRSGQIIKPKP